MTCKTCFGDLTMWRRDLNGKSVEVPCTCVGSPTLTGSMVVTGVTDVVLPPPVAVAATMQRPAFFKLKEGDVVWLPALIWQTDDAAHVGFQINGLNDINASVYLTREEYDALPHCPEPGGSQPTHTSQRLPITTDINETQQVLKWYKEKKVWFSIHWSNMRHYDDTWWMPFPNPPPPPERP